MRGIKTTTISILAIGLLAGSAVGVAAQDEEAAAMAPSWFTLEQVSEPEFSEDPATGLPIVTVELEATDQRASGTWANIEDFVHDEDDGRYRVGATSVRVENDGGAWVGTSRFVAGERLDPDGNDVAGSFAQLTGVDGYEGLTMFSFVVAGPGQETPASVAFIIPTGTVPTFPEQPAE